MANKKKKLSSTNLIPWNKGKTFNRIIIKCEVCKKEREIIKSYLKQRSGRFCSANCRNNYFATFPKYKKCIVCSSIFKDRNGGSKKYCNQKCYWIKLKQLHDKDSNNYTTIKIKNKKIRLHRYLMEQHTGRKLTKKEIVHHINGNKSDNRINNLKILSQKEHIKIHFNKIQNKLKQLSTK